MGCNPYCNYWRGHGTGCIQPKRKWFFGLFQKRWCHQEYFEHCKYEEKSKLVKPKITQCPPKRELNNGKMS
jgi:hypothetical protein